MDGKKEELDCPAQSSELSIIQYLDRKPGLITNLANALVTEWKANPCSRAPKSCGWHSQKSGGCYSMIIIVMVLEWYAEQAHTVDLQQTQSLYFSCRQASMPTIVQVTSLPLYSMWGYCRWRLCYSIRPSCGHISQFFWHALLTGPRISF